MEENGGYKSTLLDIELDGYDMVGILEDNIGRYLLTYWNSNEDLEDCGKNDDGTLQFEWYYNNIIEQWQINGNIVTADCIIFI